MNVPPATTMRQRLYIEWLSYWKDDAPRFLHILKAGTAVVLAMGLCMRLELRSPATAMLSCVIVMMHQQSGIVIARGFYRGVGMVGGSLAGLVLIALFAQQPLPFFLALAAWIGLCAYGSAYFRNFQSYGLVLTGFATSITAMPAISTPYGVFDNVVYTVSEVVIGVVCACLVSSTVLPRNVAPTLYSASVASLEHLLESIRTTLTRSRTASAPRAQKDPLLALLGERANVELLRTGAFFEDPSIRFLGPAFRELDRSFLDTFTWLCALQRVKTYAAIDAHPLALDAIDALTEATPVLAPLTADSQHIDDDAMAAWLPHLAAFETGLPGRLTAQLQTLAQLPRTQHRLVTSAGAALLFMTAGLRHYCRRYLDVRHARRLSWTFPLLQAIGRIARQHSIGNRTAALVSGVRAALAILIVGAVWVASGWVDGATAVVAVAITSTLFALLPNPSKAAWQIFAGCMCGWLTGFAFSFFALPYLGTFALLAAVVALVVMVGAYVNTFAQTAVLGLGFNIYFCFIVGISNPAVYNPTAYLDTGFALLCGIATAAVAFSVLAPSAGAWIARRQIVDLRALIASDARDGHPDDELLFAFQQRLRDTLMQIVGAPDDPRVDRQRMIAWAFAVLEVGQAMILMRLDALRLSERLPAAWRACLQTWLDALADLFDAPSAVRAKRAQDATDAALAALQSRDGVHIAPDSVEAIGFRMQALLQFTQFALLDHAPALWASTESTV
jgi:uncharacterized membrane protein YccC